MVEVNKQQPDAVTELAERIYAEIPGGTYPNQVRVWLAGLAARAVFDSGLVVPRAEWRRVGDCATQFKCERDQLRQAVLDLAERWEAEDIAHGRGWSVRTGTDCAAELRALVEGAS